MVGVVGNDACDCAMAAVAADVAAVLPPATYEASIVMESIMTQLEVYLQNKYQRKHY